MLSQHHLVSRSLVAALGATALALGPMAAIPASADPVIIQVNPGQQDAPGKKAPNEAEQKAEKAEKLGGGLVTRAIDLGAGVIKCGLSLATEAVPCKI
ncbi:hypothetical protein [Nocardia goodfellowii]|uniref:DUF732 domain-containing protein n=1 Tax=Nocardia goodfellowii TaxID=882446 RepID=A0ABS4QCS2_9NOCA|nr:hypothetical protein [Nocardia goodfellowii]MBP2189447.1 hypothetical protein [Nocardia goodfellowii]